MQRKNVELKSILAKTFRDEKERKNRNQEAKDKLTFDKANHTEHTNEVTGRKTAGDAALRKKNTEFEMLVNAKYRAVVQ